MKKKIELIDADLHIDDRGELIFRADDVHLLDNFKNGDWIKLSAVEFLRPLVPISSRGENSLFRLNCAYCKIEKL